MTRRAVARDCIACSRERRAPALPLRCVFGCWPWTLSRRQCRAVAAACGSLSRVSLPSTTMRRFETSVKSLLGHLRIRYCTGLCKTQGGGAQSATMSELSWVTFGKPSRRLDTTRKAGSTATLVTRVVCHHLVNLYLFLFWFLFFFFFFFTRSANFVCHT